jgi:hypothetical protein
LRKFLRILSEITGWIAALLLVGAASANFLPHFDPHLAPPGSEPPYACYGMWNNISSTYAFTCHTSWLRPLATWVNVSCVLITYTLRFLLMAIGRDYNGRPLTEFSSGLFEALAVFAVPTLLVLGFGVNFWFGVVRASLRRRKSSVRG